MDAAKTLIDADEQTRISTTMTKRVFMIDLLFHAAVLNEMAMCGKLSTDYTIY